MTRQSMATARWRAKLRATLFEFYGNRCNVISCQDTRAWLWEFAHLRPTKVKGRSRGQSERLMDIRDHKGHYALLCHDCHQAFDRHSL